MIGWQIGAARFAWLATISVAGAFTATKELTARFRFPAANTL
jgi:hypothetical protein